MLDGKKKGLSNHFFERKNWLVAVIVFLIALSWAGSLDQYSDDYTNSAIVQAASTYAVARGINATVSVLQTSTINAGIGFSGSITIGEVLDPVNDLIERFSEVMTVALGSLVMQKILLAITANKLFSGLLTLLGGVSLWIIWRKKPGTFPLVLKLFAILVMVRFSLGLVVLMNSQVDQVFLSGHIEQESAKLSEFKERVSNIQSEQSMSETERSDIKKRITLDKRTIKEIQDKEIPALYKKLSATNVRLSVAKSKLEKIERDQGVIATLNPLVSNPKEEAAKSTVKRLESNRDSLEQEIDQKKQQLDSLKEQMTANQALLSGEPKDIISRLKGLKQNLSVSAIEARLSGAIQGIIELLVLFLLKTVLLPLMFFYFLMISAKGIWKMGGKNI